MTKKFKDFLIDSALRAITVGALLTIAAGGFAGAAAVTAIGGATVGMGFVAAGILAGTYLGFVAGYTGAIRLESMLAGTKNKPAKDDLKIAALLPLQGAAEIARLARAPFNDAARRKRAAAPAPAQAPAPATPAAPKP